MIEFAIYALATAQSRVPTNSEPVQVCQIRTQAWCMVQTATLFDVTTVDDKKRVWSLRDNMMGSETVRVIEDRSCGSYPSDIQEKSEQLILSRVGGRSRYVILWKLHRDGSCSLRFELPVVGRKPNEIAYFLVGSIFSACTWDRCPSVSLAVTRKVNHTTTQ